MSFGVINGARITMGGSIATFGAGAQVQVIQTVVSQGGGGKGKKQETVREGPSAEDLFTESVNAILASRKPEIEKIIEKEFVEVPVRGPIELPPDQIGELMADIKDEFAKMIEMEALQQIKEGAVGEEALKQIRENQALLTVLTLLLEDDEVDIEGIT